MTCEEFESLLPRLLDEHPLEPSGAMHRHLDGCAACRSLLADLRSISVEAGELPPLEPARDLWSGIAARIEAPVVPLAGGFARARGHVSWRAAGLAAAAIVVLTSAITYKLARRGDPGGAPTEVVTIASTPAPAPTGDSSATTATSRAGHSPTGRARSVPNSRPAGPPPAPPRFLLTSNTPAGATVAYDREITRLRTILDSGRARLDPATVALLERNLRVIDTAIVQCQRALARDPASSFLIESLNTAYQTKVKVLRIAAAASKG